MDMVRRVFIMSLLRTLRKVFETNKQEAQFSKNSGDPDILALKRLVSKRKGSWYQLPMDFGQSSHKEDG